MPIGSFSVPTESQNINEARGRSGADIPEAQCEEEAALAEEEVLIKEQQELEEDELELDSDDQFDSEGEAESDEDDGEVIDDNPDNV